MIRFPIALLALLVGVVATAYPIVATAQIEISHSSEATPARTSPGEQLRYRVEISVTGNYPIELRRHPDVDRFDVLGRTSMPTTTIRNNQATRTLTLEYILRAPHEMGTFQIGPPEFSVGDEIVVPDPVEVHIVADDDPDLSRRERQIGPDQRAFVDISTDLDRSPFVGEQVILRYDLYVDRRHHRLQPRPPDDPPLDDFWVEELTNDLRLRRTTTRRYGRTWSVTPLRVLAIFPLRPGPTQIDGIDVPLVSSSLFGPSTEELLEATPLDIEVRPLPPGAPDSFSRGNVGNWSLQVDLDSSSARVGGHIELTARLRGAGRPGRLGAPTFEAPDSFRLVSTSDSTSTEIRQSRIQGERRFHYHLMPLQEGRQILPPMEFTYFDPEREEYILLRSEPLELHIEEGTVPTPIDDESRRVEHRGDEFASQSPLQDLRGLIDPEGHHNEPSPTLPLPWWIIALPLVGLLVLAFEPPISRRLALRLSPHRRRRQIKKDVEKFLSHGDDTIEARCLKALRHCLNTGLGCSLGALTTAEVVDALQRCGVPSELRREARELVSQLITTRYAPTTTRDHRLQEQTRHLVDGLLDFHFDDSRNSPENQILSASIFVIAACAAIVTVGIPIVTAADEGDDADWNAEADRWEQRAMESPQDPIVLYNAGTAAAFADDLGRARLYLERAAAMSIDEPAVEHNLAAVIAAISNENPSVAAFYQHRPAAKAFHAFAPWIVASLLWLAFAVGLIRRLKIHSTGRNTTAVLLSSSLAAAVILSLAWFGLETFSRDADFAVVTADGQTLQEAPSRHAARAYDGELPAGAVVRLKEQRDDWTAVVLPSRTRGWIPTESIENIE